MKILYVAQSFYPKVGGVENYIDSIATAMAKKGHDVYVLAPLYESTKKQNQRPEHRNNYIIYRADFKDNLKKGILYHLRAINFLPSFLKVLKKVQPDIVHFQYTNPFGVYFKLIKLKGIKCFASAHGNDILFFSNDWFAKYILKRIMIGMDGIFAVSDYSKNLLLAAGGNSNKVHVVYNGTTLKEFSSKINQTQSSETKIKRILTVCRLVERKGVDKLIKAFKKVNTEIASELYIIGDGPMRSKLQELVKRLHLEKHVYFTGKVSEDDLMEHYNSCDIFVLMSRIIKGDNEVEGFGISIVEAMSFGKPVIGGASGGIPSAIKSNWGFLVDPLDHNALADKILYLFENPAIAKKMGEKGREAVENIYNWDVITDEFLDFYK